MDIKALEVKTFSFGTEKKKHYFSVPELAVIVLAR